MNNWALVDYCFDFIFFHIIQVESTKVANAVNLLLTQGPPRIKVGDPESKLAITLSNVADLKKKKKRCNSVGHRFSESHLFTDDMYKNNLSPGWYGAAEEKTCDAVT